MGEMGPPQATLPWIRIIIIGPPLSCDAVWEQMIDNASLAKTPGGSHLPPSGKKECAGLLLSAASITNSIRSARRATLLRAVPDTHDKVQAK